MSSYVCSLDTCSRPVINEGSRCDACDAYLVRRAARLLSGVAEPRLVWLDEGVEL